MQSLTPNQWESAKSDAEELEKKIAILVEEFEQKHKPYQVNVLTRWRCGADRYDMRRQGAAQIVVHKTFPDDGNIHTKDRELIQGTHQEFIYTNAEEVYL